MSEQPPCAWCDAPAAEQIATETRGPNRLYAWLCDQCIRESERAREASRG